MHDSGAAESAGIAQLWQWIADPHVDEATWLQRVVEWLREQMGAAMTAVVENAYGSWRATALAGEAQTLPYGQLQEVADQERPLGVEEWWVGPLGPTGPFLVALGEEPWTADQLRQWHSAAASAGTILAHLRHDAAVQRRAERLQAVLDIAAHWQTTLDFHDLLHKMAETSTELLDAERASIFLWDRQRKQLVAHPALGVPGGELRIPDDTGVVGATVQSGEVQRVDPSDEDRIDRRVDVQLKFHTRSLLCVPLRDQRNRVIGAFEVINKKGTDGVFTADDEEALVELARHASLALGQSRTFQQVLRSRDRLADELAGSVQMVGECPAVASLRETLAKMADVDVTVLILGESGTGKEVAARMLHFHGARRTGPFVAVNSAALSENLIESELFGHEQGAFTGADQQKIGKFEAASGGTLFLDEIGELSESAQAKLLRVLEQRTITRVGGTEEIPVDVRVVAATNRDLAERVREGKFREDLYYRLSVIPVRLPPLRERGEDIVLLARFFLQQLVVQHGRTPLELTEGAIEKLRSYSWPGNVRELRHLMERAVLLVNREGRPADLQAKVLPDDVDFSGLLATEAGGPIPLGMPLSTATQQFQAEYIGRALKAANGNVTNAARTLGLDRSNLYRKMKQLGMDYGTEDRDA